MYEVTSVGIDEETGALDTPFKCVWEGDEEGYDNALKTYHEFLQETKDTKAVVIWSETI